MTSERQCYVYIVLPDRTEFITAGRFRIFETRDGAPRGDFVYRKRYLEQSDAVEIDPVDCRHRMASALTLLQSDDNSADRERWSYLLLADEVRRVSANSKEDLHELFACMCFNAAVSNLDDHPCNHALLSKSRDWRLSPVYDLTPMPVVALDRRDLAMGCGPNGRQANKADLLGRAGRFLLSREDAEAIFGRIINEIRASWHATMRRNGVSEHDCETVHRAFLYEGLFVKT